MVLIGLFWRPLGLLTAAGMLLLLLGAVLAHRRARDSVRESLPAVVALAVTAAYLVVA
ncbi:DoxX family protein [Dactylosporangium sp. McL0621]|uniref:DoxX family protein n=1 Tax=Dactylosporangium sp. McL0621 TaxID=3415678 RepID=UPI003CEA54CE